MDIDVFYYLLFTGGAVPAPRLLLEGLKAALQLLINRYG